MGWAASSHLRPTAQEETVLRSEDGPLPPSDLRCSCPPPRWKCDSVAWRLPLFLSASPRTRLLRPAQTPCPCQACAHTFSSVSSTGMILGDAHCHQVEVTLIRLLR